MNRRQFFATGGLTAATGMTSLAPAASRAIGSGPSGLFRTINLQSDGLALDPREYTELLGNFAATQSLQADNYSAGGAVEELEQRFAGLLGKPAAIFLPTGTLANHLAVRTLAGGERRVVVQAESHLYNDSGDCAQTLSGLNLVPLAPGRSTFELSELESWIERSAGGRVETRVGAVSIESPVRRRDHEMFDRAELERICGHARERGIRLHLDGARMFTLPQHSGKSIRQYTSLFDTVYVSLWKHFNGGSGAILAGEGRFIEGLSQTRRMFGGSLPQAWPEIALVTQSAERFQEQYARAWKLADELIGLLRSDERFKVRKLANGTSRFFLSVSGASSQALLERLSRRGVILSPTQAHSGEFPVQVNPTLLRTTAAALYRAIIESMQ